MILFSYSFQVCKNGDISAKDHGMLPANTFATTAMLFGGLMLMSLNPNCSQRMEMEQHTSPMAAIREVHGFDLWDVGCFTPGVSYHTKTIKFRK
jgi:hypothetical protein